MEIKRQIVSPSIASKVTYGGRNPFTTVTVHQTGNKARGAGAQTHANLQSNGNARAASWHWSVDDKIAVQSFEHTAQCWAAGDGRGPGNTASVHVEICINSDADYTQSVANGARLVAKLLADNGLSISAVKQHYDWSRKNCPAQIRAGQAGITWADFIAMVNGAEAPKTAPSPKPQTGGTQVESKPAPKPASNLGLVDWMNANKMNSSYANRAKLAEQHGIPGYKGTAAQNTALLAKLQGAPTSKPAPKKPKYTLPSGVLRRGAKGQAVRQLQTALNAANFRVGTVDGDYGPKTEDAVRRFQSVHLPREVDGVYGPNTRKALDKAVN